MGFSIVTNVPILWGNVENGKIMQYGGRVYMSNSVLSTKAQFFCASKTAKKNSLFFLIKERYRAVDILCYRKFKNIYL